MYMAYHQALAKAACEPWLSPAVMDLIIGANFNCDLLGNIAWKILEHKIYPLIPIGRVFYNNNVHIDEKNTFEEISVAWRGRMALLDRYLDPAQPAPLVRIIRNLGHVTHSAADIYTHSNYMELLYDHYRAAGISDARLAGHISENAPLISEFIEEGFDAYPELKSITDELFSDQCLPDEGPRSHAEINKDTPKAPRCNDPRYPDIFPATFGLAQRETIRVVNRFMERLRDARSDVFEALRAIGAGQPFKEPGRSARRAKRLTDLVGTWD